MNTKQARQVGRTEIPFSMEALRQVSDGENNSRQRAVELNEMAKQVAELFSSDAVSPRLISSLVRLGEFAGLAAVAVAIRYFLLAGVGGSMLLYAAAVTLGTALTVTFVQSIDGYQTSVLKHFVAQFTKAVAGFTLAMGQSWLTVCQRAAAGKLPTTVEGVIDSAAVKHLFEEEFRKRMPTIRKKDEQ